MSKGKMMTEELAVSADNAHEEIQGAPEAENEQEAVTEEAQPDEVVEEPKAETPKRDPWPSSAKRAMSRRDKKIGHLEAQIAHLKQQGEQLQQKQQPKETPSAPSMENFDTMEEYVQALAHHTLQQNQSQEKPLDPEQLRKEAYEQAQREVQNQQRAEYIGQKLQEVSKQFPDYHDVLSENADILDDLPEAIQDAFKFSDNPPLAMYNLAKAGHLENLAFMNPYQAAGIIAAASSQQVKPVSKAPTPVKGVSGSKTKSSKGILDMSPDELDKWRTA